MPIAVIDNGKNNVLDAPEAFLKEQAGRITFSGSNNTIRIGEGCTAARLSFEVGDESQIDIGAKCLMAALEIHLKRGASVTLGPMCTFSWDARFHGHEPYNITIGRECMFAPDTWLTVSDMHSILDLQTRQRINPGADITLGTHVWLAESARVFKGARIGDGSIIGAGSLVLGNIPPNSLAVGTPARVVREGVGWDSRLL